MGVRGKGQRGDNLALGLGLWGATGKVLESGDGLLGTCSQQKRLKHASSYTEDNLKEIYEAERSGQ